jgi:hypothetical protein
MREDKVDTWGRKEKKKREVKHLVEKAKQQLTRIKKQVEKA